VSGSRWFCLLADGLLQVAGGLGRGVTRGGATLHATVVTPTPPRIEFGLRTQYRLGAKRGVAKLTSRALFVEGGDNFFVVLTIQPGPAPEVKVEGEGLDAKVRVGARTIAFDGQKILFGE
jgi:hypothetical protein